MFEDVEQQVRGSVEWLRLAVESLGAVVIAAGVVVVAGLVRFVLAGGRGSFVPIRLAFARYLTLALELQLAYFLGKELKDERASAEPALRAGVSAPARGE